jgi:3-deoxy-7-phosphoheptulonate synthase
MIIVIKQNAPEMEIRNISKTVHEHWGMQSERISGRNHIVIGLIGDTAEVDTSQVQKISPWIERVLRVQQPFKRVSREFRHGEGSEVSVRTPNGWVTFGEHCPIVVTAGPCSVESEEMIIETAQRVKAAGAQFLRGGAYKPRSSPYSFQGYGESALGLLAAARAATGLGIITEIMNSSDLQQVSEVADIVQIGARNMQNFSLLKKVGAQDKPILLKRGMAATIDEWLLAAEYLLAAGNPNVILCERGIRTFDAKYARNTLDLSTIPVLRGLTHLPIMIDPSHGTGRSEYVPSMAMAAIAAGTDSLMIEVHPDPTRALSDGPQSLTPQQFDEVMPQLTELSRSLGRGVAPAPALAALA